jgi:hypothetical protein
MSQHLRCASNKYTGVTFRVTTAGKVKKSELPDFAERLFLKRHSARVSLAVIYPP